MPKRKASTAAVAIQAGTTGSPAELPALPEAKRRAGGRGRVPPQLKTETTNPDVNSDILDGEQAMRASPDATGAGERFGKDRVAVAPSKKRRNPDADEESLPSLTAGSETESPLSDLPGDEPGSPGKVPATAAKRGRGKKAAEEAQENTSRAAPSKAEKSSGSAQEQFLDPEADGDMEAGEEEIQAASTRPPPVNSDYLPLPWKGRLGYACLNTYLRYSNPPVFASRTCRIASILENRHPLKFPDQPPHATKNRPDKDQPADVARGQRYVESLGVANARDCIKIIRWNERYNIKFLRLSSEMFPFASHEEYGYQLAPFAAETLAQVGAEAAKYGHRLTTHPGQFTQLGSPRQVVIDNAIRDLEYHEELLSLLNLPPQQDRDAVMILHLGGVFGDKTATLQRFRENYAKLSEPIKKRLVLENDDVSWSVHDLLPVCEELNIPFVLDFHHHNIVFDAGQIREGTKDIVDLFPRILATWKRKGITPKMHYSEQTPPAITPMQRRKHSPRVMTLPPCPPDMDLMIEAKDKEQAVFELMRTLKLPGFDRIHDIVPHVRPDDNKPVKTPKKQAAGGKKKKAGVKKEDEDDDDEAAAAEKHEEPKLIPDEEVGMGGPEGRVYWPPGMEEWLRPKKRVVKKKDDGEAADGAKGKNKGKKAAADAAADAAKAAAKLEAENAAAKDGPAPKATAVSKTKGGPAKIKGVMASAEAARGKRTASIQATPAGKGGRRAKKAKLEEVEENEVDDMSEEASEDMDDLNDDVEPPMPKAKAKSTAKAKTAAARPQPGRRASRKTVNYAEDDEE